MNDFLIITISMFIPPVLGYGIRRLYLGRSGKNIPPPSPPASSFDVTQKDFGGEKDNPYDVN